jgi:type III secretory pathway component EscS
MSSLALFIYIQALMTALEIALPLVCVAAAVGVLVGLLQTLFQIQDQNVAFAPKLAGIAACVAVGGSTGFALLLSLFSTVVAAAVHLART